MPRALPPAARAAKRTGGRASNAVFTRSVLVPGGGGHCPAVISRQMAGWSRQCTCHVVTEVVEAAAATTEAMVVAAVPEVVVEAEARVDGADGRSFVAMMSRHTATGARVAQPADPQRALSGMSRTWAREAGAAERSSEAKEIGLRARVCLAASTRHQPSTARRRRTTRGRGRWLWGGEE